MRTYRIVRLLSTICFLGLALSVPLRAQDDPAFTTASQAYSSYHGGDIDHIDLFSGNLTLDIPLMSYPQKGGKLNLSFALHYQSGPATDTQYCDDSGDCWDNWTSFAHGWVVGPTGTPLAGSTPDYQGQFVAPYCAMTQDQYGNPYAAYCYFENSIQTPDQAIHQLLPTSTTTGAWKAVDGSGW